MSEPFEKPLWVNFANGFPLLPGVKVTDLSWATEGPDVTVWSEIGIAFKFSRFHDSHGELTAMVRIFTRGMVGYTDNDLYDAKIILTGSNSKTAAVRACEKQVPDWPYWTQTVDKACRIVRTYIEEGTPPVDISIGDETPEPPWLIEPLFRESENALLFGDGGTGKSTLALWFLLQMPPGERALYLDYEDSEATMRRRLRSIGRGMGMDPIDRPVMYKQADGALPAIADAISRQVADAKIRGLVIDSAALACGAEPESAEAANGYFRAIRGLRLDWTLTIAHQPKSKENNSMPFGSVFWWNNPRTIWQTRKVQEPGEDNLHVGLWHRKSNNGRLQKERAYELVWNQGSVLVQPELPRVNFREHVSQEERVIGVMEDLPTTTWTHDELARASGIPAGSLYSVLSRLGKKGKVQKKGEQIGLVYADSLEPPPYWAS